MQIGNYLLDELPIGTPLEKRVILETLEKYSVIPKIRLALAEHTYLFPLNGDEDPAKGIEHPFYVEISRTAEGYVVRRAALKKGYRIRDDVIL